METGKSIFSIKQINLFTFQYQKIYEKYYIFPIYSNTNIFRLYLYQKIQNYLIFSHLLYIYICSLKKKKKKTT